jgi:hypothetical protein
MTLTDIPANGDLEVLGVAQFNKKENTIILLICKENGLVANKNSQKRICEYFNISEGVRA